MEIESNQKIAVLRHNFHIDGRDNGESQNADDGCTDLNGDVTEVAAELIGRCGAGDDDTAKRWRDETQKKQHPVTLFGEVLQFG